MRGPGGGRGRHVLHRRLRAGHDGRRHRGGAGAEPAVVAVPDLQAPQGRHRDLRCRPGHGQGAGRRRRPCVLGLRFTHDPFCFPERFDTLAPELGDGFIAVELDSSPGNPHGHPKIRALGPDRAPGRPPAEPPPGLRWTRSSISSSNAWNWLERSLACTGPRSWAQPVEESGAITGSRDVPSARGGPSVADHVTGLRTTVAPTRTSTPGSLGGVDVLPVYFVTGPDPVSVTCTGPTRRGCRSSSPWVSLPAGPCCSA